VVNRYDASLAEAMRANAHISAEAIIGAFAVAGNDSRHLCLPQSLSNVDVDQVYAVLSWLHASRCKSQPCSHPCQVAV